MEGLGFWVVLRFLRGLGFRDFGVFKVLGGLGFWGFEVLEGLGS